MIEKSCLQKYIEALMTVAKKNGEKVKIEFSDGTYKEYEVISR